MRTVVWYIRFGIPTALELWWRCDLPFWTSLDIMWDVSKLDVEYFITGEDLKQKKLERKKQRERAAK